MNMRTTAPTETGTDTGTAAARPPLPPFIKMNWLPRDIAVDRRADGSMVLQSRIPLQPFAPHIPALLDK